MKDGLAALLHRGLRRCGVDLKRFNALNDRHLMRQRILRSHAIDTVIDGGANRGQYALCLREYGYAGRIVSIEPGRAAFAALEKRAARDLLWNVERAALCQRAGDARELLVTRNSVSSSLLTASNAMSVIPGAEVVGRESVAVTTLDAIADEHVHQGNRVLVKLDVQGGEGDALEGGRAALERVELVEVELALEELYEGQLSADETSAWLGSRGFRTVAMAPNTIDPSTGHVLEVDVLFARSER